MAGKKKNAPKGCLESFHAYMEHIFNPEIVVRVARCDAAVDTARARALSGD